MLIELTYFEFFLIQKLIIYNYIGSKRTTLPNISRGVETKDKKSIKRAFKVIKRKGFINIHSRKGGEPYFSLIPSKVAEINNILLYNSCDKCGKYKSPSKECEYCNKNI